MDFKHILTITRAVVELSKVKITIAVAFTTITGYLLAARVYDWGFLWSTAGIFLLACGSSVVNHIQEIRFDAGMERTRSRPLPAGVVSVRWAWLLAILQITGGSVILVFLVSPVAWGFGMLAGVWYNLIYTTLKRKTAHAVIPGSLIGSIPPLVGWIAGGGEWLSFQSFVLASFFFLWQIPHFYLLAVKYGHQYRQAGFPTLTDLHPVSSIGKQVYAWTFFTAAAAAGVAFSPLVVSVYSRLGLVLLGIWLLWACRGLLSSGKADFSPIKYFLRINSFVLLAVLVLCADPWLSTVG